MPGTDLIAYTLVHGIFKHWWTSSPATGMTIPVGQTICWTNSSWDQHLKPNVGDLPVDGLFVHGKSLSLQAGRYDRHRFFVHLAGFGGTWWLSAGIHRIFRHPHLWKPIASWVRIMLNLNISITLTFGEFGGQWLKHPQVHTFFVMMFFDIFLPECLGCPCQISPAEARQNVTVTVDATWCSFVDVGWLFQALSPLRTFTHFWCANVVKPIINKHSIPNFTGNFGVKWRFVQGVSLY